MLIWLLLGPLPLIIVLALQSHQGREKQAAAENARSPAVMSAVAPAAESSDIVEQPPVQKQQEQFKRPDKAENPAPDVAESSR